MQKKLSEKEFKGFCNRRGINAHKFADILKCPSCRSTIWQSGRMPDYEISYKGLKTLVEVKQGESRDGRWNFGNKEKGIREIQRESLDEWLTEQGVMPWLFLVVGNGRAPDGRGAFLVPWEHWKMLEQDMLSIGQRTINLNKGRNPGAEEILKEYKMTWVKDDDSGWDIPPRHPFFEYLGSAVMANKFVKSVQDAMEYYPPAALAPPGAS